MIDPWTHDDHSKVVCSKQSRGMAISPTTQSPQIGTVYPEKYAHGFVVLCFVVVTQSFIMNSHEVFIHIHQGCFAGTGAIVRLPQCQWSKPDGYGEISQCITTARHSKAKTVCIFLGIYCISCSLPCLVHIIYYVCNMTLSVQSSRLEQSSWLCSIACLFHRRQCLNSCCYHRLPCHHCCFTSQ